MRFKTFSIALILLTLLLSLIPIPVNAQVLSLNPFQGVVGTEVAISSICSYGSGEFFIYWGEAQELIRQGSAEGCTAVYFTVPDATRGKHKVTLKISGKTFEGQFTVKPSIAVSPLEDTVGSTVNIRGKGFNTNEQGIQITFDGNSIVTGLSADKKGSWQGTLKIPAAKGGEHLIDAFGVTPASDVEDIVFKVKPKIDINPTSGGVGTTVTVEGNGFGSGETDIKIAYDDVVQKTAIAANSAGFWRSSFNVPPSTRGMHSISAYGSETAPGKVASVVFTVSPVVKLELSDGYLGSPIKVGDRIWVTGIGFEENESGIQILFDGNMIYSGVVADAKGSWAVQIEVPLCTQGNHVITASGGTAQESSIKGSTIVVSPGIIVTPETASIGQELSIAGNGFNVNQRITVSIDGIQVSSGIMTDVRGSFKASFKVPKIKSGDHTVTAMDASSAVASSSLKIESIAPPAPKLISPEAGAKIEASWGTAIVPFHWETVEDPSGIVYTFELSRSPDFANILVRKEGLSLNEYVLTKAEALNIGEYYWRVKAVDGALNESPWSTVQVLIIKGFELNVIIIIIIVAVIIVALIIWRIIVVTRRGGWRSK